MSRWLVSQVPAGLLLAGLIVAVAGGAISIQGYVRRRYPGLRAAEHNDVTKFTYGFIGFVYAFFIGFVVSAMWGEINGADANARAEGAAAVQMAREAVAFDAADGNRVRQSLLAYQRAAIAEWSGTERSPEADAALVRLYTEYGRVVATTDTQKTLLASSFSHLDAIAQARTVRILTAREDAGPPWPLWLVIFITSGLALGTVIVYGVERPVLHYSMVTVVGVVVAANLFLVLQLAHPYVGAVATSSDPLQEAVHVLAGSRP
jgi:hypothetical protein